jgi:hypothetical protein
VPAAPDLQADLAWWRAHRAAPTPADAAAAREVLDRLRAWKAEHDRGRAGQPIDFLKMVWDAILGDDEAAVAEAIADLEAKLE